MGATAFEDNVRLIEGKCKMEITTSIGSAKATVKAGLDATGIMLTVDASAVSTNMCDKVTIDYGEGLFANGFVVGRKGAEVIIAGFGGKISDKEIKLCVQVCVTAKVNWEDVGDKIKDFFVDIGKKTEKWVNGAVDDTGKWVKGAAEKVKDFFSGF